MLFSDQPINKTQGVTFLFYLTVARSVVVETVKYYIRSGCALALHRVLVDVVAQMEDPIMLVLSGRVAVYVEVAGR